MLSPPIPTRPVVWFTSPCTFLGSKMRFHFCRLQYTQLNWITVKMFTYGYVWNDIVQAGRPSASATPTSTRPQAQRWGQRAARRVLGTFQAICTTSWNTLLMNETLQLVCTRVSVLHMLLRNVSHVNCGVSLGARSWIPLRVTMEVWRRRGWRGKVWGWKGNFVERSLWHLCFSSSGPEKVALRNACEYVSTRCVSEELLLVLSVDALHGLVLSGGLS